MFIIMIGRIHTGIVGSPHRVSLTRDGAIAWLKQNGYIEKPGTISGDIWQKEADVFAWARIDSIPLIED